MSKELEVNAPKVIYLRIGDDHEGEYSDEATWCADKIHNTDIAYVLRSGYDSLEATKEDALDHIQKMMRERDELAAKLAEAEATCEALRNDGINKIMEATDDQIDALIRMEGSNPDDIANLAKKVAELAIANVKLAEAERQLEELRGLRKQEPVAWIHPLYKESGFKLVGITRWSDDCLPLYAAPIPPTVPDTNLETATNRNYLESIGQLPPTEGSKP